MIRPLIAALAATTLLAAPVGAQPIDPALEQEVTAGEQLSDDAVTISSGHVDLGPYLTDNGELRLLVRDDTDVDPVWRSTDDVTFAVGNAAELEVPDDSAYDFLESSPGKTVWVVPQTEVADVPWLGWNTQSPSIDEITETGVELEILEHRGPGDHALFIQAGGFSDPDVLWTGRKHDSIFAEADTHTHANWVFTQPGSHLVTVRSSIKAADGTTHTADAQLRFAVGIDPADWTMPDESMITKEDSSFTMVWVVLGSLLAAGLIVFAFARFTTRRTDAEVTTHA